MQVAAQANVSSLASAARGSGRRGTVAVAWLAVSLGMVPFTAGAVDSMSNEVELIETLDGGEVLLVWVRTSLYATRGSDDPENPNINPVCPNHHAAAIRLDAATPAEAIELELIQKAVETARIGPLRIRLLIVQDECIRIADYNGDFPVATGVKLLQAKERDGSVR